MSNSDPKRLLDQLAEEGRHGHDDLSAMLRAGKSEVPNNAQMLALAAKIGVLGGLGGAGAAGLGGAGGAGSAGAGAGAGGAGAGAKVAVGVSAAKAGLAIKIGGAVVVASAAVGTGAVVVSRNDAMTTRAPVGIVATVSSSTNIVMSARPQTQANAGSGTSILPPLDDTASASPPSAHVAPRPSPSSKASAEGFEVEVRLLERAQDALRSRPAEALALADDHARRFPQGMLVQEREVIAIEALVKLGRTSDAKARATRFKARFPGSSHTRRIDALLGE